MSSRLDDLILEAIHSRSGSSIVDVATILERVDSTERWLLTFPELDGGLRRLSETGRIGEVSVGRYVSAGSRHPTGPYSGLTLERYEAAVTAYRTAFAADVEWLMRSPFLRAPVGLMRWCYQLTGGRFGLAPGSVDLDAVAIAFAVDRVIGPRGAEAGDLSVEGDSLVIPVFEGDVSLDRAAVLDDVTEAVRRHKHRRTVVIRFSDRDEVIKPA